MIGKISNPNRNAGGCSIPMGSVLGVDILHCKSNPRHDFRYFGWMSGAEKNLDFDHRANDYAMNLCTANSVVIAGL
jgi:hypothetical protein